MNAVVGLFPNQSTESYSSHAQTGGLTMFFCRYSDLLLNMSVRMAYVFYRLWQNFTILILVIQNVS